MTSLSVLIPSRLDVAGNGRLFLESAVASIRAQKLAEPVAIRILVGVDRGAKILPGLAEKLDVRIIESEGASQAAVLNAAARQIDAAHVAILEDDDIWNPEFLAVGFKALQSRDFVSSTQLEVDPGGVVIRVNDFPTPSGWLMRREVWDSVGQFDETYRFHLDNDWLGRLGETKARRAHLIEASAPIDPAIAAQVRPWLMQLIRQGRPGIALARHASPWPLVTRLVHPQSGMNRIARTPALRERSEQEIARLMARFGHVPW